MVSKRVEYGNYKLFVEMENKAGVINLHEVNVIADKELPKLTEPKTEEYLIAKETQIHFQNFKASVIRLWSKLHSDYFKNALNWIEVNILPDLNVKQIKSLRFRAEVYDEETGKKLMETYPAGKSNFLSWSEIMQAKALSQGGFGMEKLISAKRARKTSTPIKINKFYTE